MRERPPLGPLGETFLCRRAKLEAGGMRASRPRRGGLMERMTIEARKGANKPPASCMAQVVHPTRGGQNRGASRRCPMPILLQVAGARVDRCEIAVRPAWSRSPLLGQLAVWSYPSLVDRSSLGNDRSLRSPPPLVRARRFASARNGGG